jgi:hypothetical protein
LSLVGGLRGFLAAVGLASAVATVAVAQPPGSRAGLLPPRPLDATEVAPIARGAIPDTPTSATTPVPRSNTKAPPPATTGPAWLSGIDPNVLPAAGNSTSTASTKSGVMTAGPFGGLGSSAPRPSQPTSREEQGAGKGIERFKSGITGNDRGATDSKAPADTPNASTPFRGTTSNGAPIFAGPPAYRWYGYGSVTPGANPYAPSGLYPKASANWYSVTGATPGAFPVPVANPQRQPGIDPPSYAGGPANRIPGIIPTTSTQPAFSPTFPPPSMPVITSMIPPPPSDVKVIPLPSSSGLEPTRPVSPISTPVRPDSSAMPVGPAAPIGVPTIAPPPGAGAAVPLPPLLDKPSATLPNEVKPVIPVGLAPPVNVVPPLGPDEPALLPTKPTPLPLTTTKPAGDEPRWQPGEQPGLPEGTWTPAVGQPKPLNQPESMRPADQLRIRAQMPDGRTQADPTADLIRAVCQGRATGIDIRWTGSRRLAVCFESRSEPDAAALVRDISARRELAPLQIDFCVFVK